MTMEDKPFLKLVRTERDNRKNSNGSREYDSQGGSAHQGKRSLRKEESSHGSEEGDYVPSDTESPSIPILN